MQTPTTQAPLGALAAVIACTILGSVAFTSPWFPLEPLIGLEMATGHWIGVTLVATLAIGGLGIAISVLWGRQRLRDLGWRREDLASAALATLALWLTMHAATVTTALLQGKPLVLAAGWSNGAFGGAMLGPLLAQLLGNALTEESNFRGFLWPQLALRFGRRWRAPVAVAVAAVVSQLVFSSMHVPIRLYQGADAATLATMLVNLLLIGLVFCLVYAWTRNLFLVAGYHALLNTPTPVFEPLGPSPQLVATVAVLSLALGMWLKRRARLRRTSGVAAVIAASTA
jgi:membrane protease YdiL (CAAX protease family)